MSSRVEISLSIAGAFFLLALVGAVWAMLRNFVRRSIDGALVGWRKDENHIPWWAYISGACAALAFDMALPPGVWIASIFGVIPLVVGLREGYISNWRLFGLFDRRDADRVPQVYRPSLAEGQAAAVFGAGQRLPGSRFVNRTLRIAGTWP